VIVVGAGMIGASIAYELMQRDVQVTVIDASFEASGTTAEGMGHILVMDGSPAELALTTLSHNLWRALAPELPDAGQWDPCGTVWVARTQTELDALSGRCSTLAAAGHPSEILDEAQLREAEPELAPGLAGGLRIPTDAVVYPPTIVAWMLEGVSRSGGRILLRTSVAEIGNGCVELASGETLEADYVVNACGLHALDLLERPIDNAEIISRKGHLIITDRYEGMIRHQLLEAGYLDKAHAATDDSVAFNLQPRTTGQLLLGSSRQNRDTSRDIDSELMAMMVSRALEYVPGLAEVNAIRAWAGHRPATPDALPYIGPHPDAQRTIIAAGHEGLGITTSLGTARLIADHVLGQDPPIDPQPYLPGRSVH